MVVMNTSNKVIIIQDNPNYVIGVKFVLSKENSTYFMNKDNLEGNGLAT